LGVVFSVNDRLSPQRGTDRRRWKRRKGDKEKRKKKIVMGDGNGIEGKPMFASDQWSGPIMEMSSAGWAFFACERLMGAHSAS